MARGWPFIWDVRCRTPRATDPSGGAEGPPGSAGKRRFCPPLLLGLAPGGVFPAAAVAGGAVRSCRTVSPLPPARRAEAGWRCTFCGTFPGVAPAGRYPAPYLRGARTFLSPRNGGERPSGRLAPGDLGCRDASVKASPGGPAANCPLAPSRGIDNIAIIWYIARTF